MGIFAEDLINFGNLMEVNIPFDITKKDLENLTNLSLEIDDTGLFVFLNKKTLIFNKKERLKLNKENSLVKNNKRQDIRAIGFKPLLPERLKDILNSSNNSFEENSILYINLSPLIKSSELYQKVPSQFRERLIINSYQIKDQKLTAFIGVEK